MIISKSKVIHIPFHLFGLRGRFFRSGSGLLGTGHRLLNHLVHLGHGMVDLSDTRCLLS